MSLSIAVLAILALLASLSAQGQPAPFVPDEANSWIFPSKFDVDAASAIDLRNWNEAVAGEHGFITISEDGRGFVRGDGKPIRFWAVHASQNQSHWSDAHYHDYARFLARMGVNLALAGTLLEPEHDQPDIQIPSASELDYAWKRVAALKAQGIYSELRGAWFHGGFQQAPGIEGYGAGDSLHGGVIFFSPTLREAYKAWVHALFTRVNPYTGLPLNEDPAVALFTFLNEDTAFFYTFHHLKGAPLRMAQEGFADWASEQYGSAEEALAAWKETPAKGDDLEEGRLGFLGWWLAAPDRELDRGTQLRLQDQAAFLLKVQQDFYTQMTQWLKEEVGFQGMVMTSNFRPAVPETMGDLENAVKAIGDVIGMNAYPSTMQHAGENRGWQVAPGDQYSSTPAARDPLALPFWRRQVAGQPFMITEMVWPNPHEYANEAALLSAIYGGVTGISAVSFAGPRDVAFSGESFFFPFGRTEAGGRIAKFNCSEPAQLAAFPAAAIIARRGDAHQTLPAVVEAMPPKKLLAFEPPMLPQGRDFDPLHDKTMETERADSTLSPGIFLTGAVLSDFNADPTTLAPGIENWKEQAVVQSLDGQVTTDSARGLITLDSPKAQVVIGELADAGEVELSTITVRSSNAYLGIAVVALDDQPLAESNKILVQLSPRARPTGWQVEPVDFKPKPEATAVSGWRILRTGDLPFRVEKVDGTLLIGNEDLSTADVLDANGVMRQSLPLASIERGKQLSLPKEALYVILR